MQDKNLDYLNILKALDEIPFGVGKKLLTEFLQGKKSHESIVKNSLYQKDSFGSLAYSKDELNALIESLILNDLIKSVPLSHNKFWKVLELSEKGKIELKDPSLFKKKICFNFDNNKTIITDEEKKAFSILSSFLNKFDDFQKKAIICNNSKILCIAGAGSGKTAVLTERIKFLVNYRSVDPRKILAITFTRKARQEMMSRLHSLPDVNVETFNSFCEKILKKHNNIFYEKDVRVLTYRDKIIILNKAISSLGLSVDKAIDAYFSFSQIRDKSPDQLLNILLNDCFFIRDYFLFKNIPLSRDSFSTGDFSLKKSADMIFKICSFIESYMHRNGLRDFADQLMHTLRLFEKNKELIPKFSHVLVDEFQDVNSTQIKLIDILSPENLFCVGDPRQSIFGWRGSDIKHILKFEEKYPNCEIITLTKNYRSSKPIVKLINSAIKTLALPDLEGVHDKEKDINLLKFDSESEEFEFIIQKILESPIPKKEIFVLARTNRQLNELSQLMRLRNINHIVRSDEMRKSIIAGESDVTLATIHSIKGLEAEMVFIVGCTSLNFPCKGSEHPVIDLVKIEEYDKEEEERRLFYVAMSRAKSMLYLSYSGKKHTYFLTEDMLKLIDEKNISVTKLFKSPADKIVSQKNSNKYNDLFTQLKEWRMELSRKSDVPPYIIMHDKTLIDICQKNPLTEEDLNEVHGLGPAKIMKYGEDILKIINGC